MPTSVPCSRSCRCRSVCSPGGPTRRPGPMAGVQRWPPVRRRVSCLPEGPFPCTMGAPSLPQHARSGLWAGPSGSLLWSQLARMQRLGEKQARVDLEARDSPPLIPWQMESIHLPTRTFETRKPMTAEQQLERSVLEGKERDELHAIAQALSVKTNTRTKKADMIDGILKATGVSVDAGTPGAAGSSNGTANPASENGAPSGNGRRRSTASRSV